MYRRNNFSYVIDSSFQPFTMQEMLTPFVAYKDAYEQSEAAYTDLSDKSDQFAYLSKTLPEGSRAREIYEGYANDLKTQAEDLARNGLTMGNRRALTSLKRRYQGEIGTLVQAKQAMDEEKKLRKAKYAQDPSMIYADDVLSIDKFLEGSEPNLYGISGNDLYAKGAAAGKAYSSRIFGTQDAGSILNGYYIDYVQRMGYDPASLNQFQREMLSKGFTEQISTLPELQQAAQSILEANGATDNLTGNNLRRAQQQVIRGIIDGSVYTEAHNPQRDLGKLSKAESISFDLQRQQMDRQAAQNGLFWNNQTKSFEYKLEKDPRYQMQKALLGNKASINGGSSGSSSDKYPAYEGTYFKTNGGGYIEKTEDNANKFDDFTSSGNKVRIEKTPDGNYRAFVKDGKNNTLTLGTITSKGDINTNRQTTNADYKQFFGSSKDNDYDDDTVELMLQDIADIIALEGSEGYKNYDIVFSPDNVNGSNKNGGFVVASKKRSPATVYNSPNGLGASTFDFGTIGQ